MTRDVGEMGENTLRAWAAQVGITANRAERDRTGWDYLLELPAPDNWSIRGGALDTAAETIKCLVQVKSTDGNRSSVPVTLANLRLLISASLPSFLLVLQFDDLNTPQRAYLVEMNESRAAPVLKRIRELSHMKSPERLVRKTRYSVRFGPEDLLDGLDGAGLKAAVTTAVGRDMGSYLHRKHAWLETVGYGQGRTQLKVSFRLPDGTASAAEALADLTLGLKPELEVLGGELLDVRFGIPAPDRLAMFGAGGHIRLAARKPVAKAVLRFRDPQGIEINLNGDAYVPFGLGSTPDESALKVRVESTFVDVVFAPLNPSDFQITLRLVGGDEDCDLDELRAASDLMLLWMRPGGQGIEVAEMDFIVDGRHFFNAKLAGVGDADQDAIHRSQAAVEAWKVATLMGFASGCRVRPAELFQQEKELKLLAGVLGGDAEAQSVEFGSDDDEFKAGDELGIPIALAVRIGEFTTVIVGGILGTVAPIDGPTAGRHTHRLVRKRFRLLHRLLLRAGEKRDLRRNDLLSEVADAYKAEATMVRWWEPNA